MKTSITSATFRMFGIAFAAVLFSAGIFASPVAAGILDGDFSCLPLPVCPDSPALDCFPLPVCPDRDGGNHRPRQTQYVSRTTYAEPAPASTPAPQPQPSTPPVVTNTNTNTNTNTVIVNGGGGYSYPNYPTYYPSYPSYDYNYYPSYGYYPSYQYQTVAPLSVSCSANTTYTTPGNQVVWRAFVTGGYGYYTYSWTGTDGLYGQSQSVAKVYQYPGQKTGYVTVYSNGLSASAYCPNITVGAPVVYQPVPVPPPVYQPVPQYPQGPSLDIACYANPTKTRVGQPVTWTAEIHGGYGPYRISWSGTNGLTGSSNSVTKYYGTSGIKKATVTATSANGITTTRNCGVTVTVSAPVAKAQIQPPVQQQPPVYQPQYPQYPEPTVTPESQTSNAFFSMANVPWGWVAFLVILILFVTVIYLLFNRLKI
jgi:hypothetical protein